MSGGKKTRPVTAVVSFKRSRLWCALGITGRLCGSPLNRPDWPPFKPALTIFPGRDGNSPLWPGVWMQKHLQRVAKQIGITVPVTFQVLRRSFVTRHRNQLKDAGAVVGHSNYATTTANVYAQSVEASVIAMLEEDERRIGLMEHPI